MLYRTFHQIRTNVLANKKVFIVVAIFMLFVVFGYNGTSTSYLPHHRGKTQIIVVTPTYRRSTRLADMTRLANTLRFIPDVVWIVVEDGTMLVDIVSKLLDRSNVTFYYMAYKTQPGYPKRGWYQRDIALDFLRKNWSQVAYGYQHSVVYFADDDNAYDIRLFNDYIRNVQRAGIWAVGLVGGVPVESPVVSNNTVIGWHVKWNPRRRFATDMAGFAVSLDLILNSNAKFGTDCKRGAGAPETCFLEDLGLKMQDLEPFGFDKTTLENKRKELLVWHTKTVSVKFNKTKVDFFGFMAHLITELKIMYLASNDKKRDMAKKD